MSGPERPEVVLLHGVGLDSRMWARCRLGRHHRVRALDLPGHGNAPPVRGEESLAGLAERVAARIPGPAHLVGFSLGALVAQRIALDHPARVATLSLVSSVANRSPEQAAAVRERLRTAEHDFAASARAAVQRWMSPRWRREEPELAEQLLATLLANDRDSYLACYRVFATADAELWPRLGAITAPTLCITGGEDTGSTPEMTRALAAALPRGRAVVVPGARHLLPLERPDVLTEHLSTHIEESRSEQPAL
ncbi:alpha/beta fold hydrolase [Saccharopolyspora rosea]|uniref:alpha/beta fold hydrolase n=1 Tax=Saccharopolyspora rosea TaxID=524884 RepID=UPI0021D9F19F|nr:alpha/beta hydrolase [Saccharopolyspora rosea]